MGALGVSGLGSFFVPASAQAFLGIGDVVTNSTNLDAPRLGEWILTAAKNLGIEALTASISTALINTSTYAADRLAYDAAVFISSGGDGGDPLFENRTVGEYFADYGASVAGEALGELDDTGILGNFSLCQPTDSTVTLAFKFGLQGVFQRPKPKCNFNEVKDNWSGFLSNIATTGGSPFEKNSQVLTVLADAYNPKENDFSVGINLYSDVLTKAQTDAALAAQREMFGGFFKDKTDFLTGRVETPAELLQKKLSDKLANTDEIRQQIAIQALGDKDILKQIGLHAGSVFTNTLLSKFTEKLYNGLFGDLDQSSVDPFSDVNFSSSTGSDARTSFRSFLTAAPLSITNYSVLGEFSACPSQSRSLYNCVADSSLISAVSRADSGAPMTLAEAIADDLINSSWPLIPSSDAARDQDPYCYTYGYCHGNLVKLRKARIISTGWELAAESSANSEASPITLGEVVDGFYDCNEQNEIDDNHPWCHLIDPNWVLKYPETQCKAQVYGQELVSSASDERQTECVDMPSCIDSDASGNCTGGYGYCVREANIWRFRGEECPDYYGSCTTYQSSEGSESSFLSNTTDSGECTADSVGCLWYATQKTVATDLSANWPDYSMSTLLSAADAASDVYRNRIFFTSEVKDCAADDAGCKELVGRTDGNALNMVMNPSFEDDDGVDGVPDGWMLTGTGAIYSINNSSALSGSDALYVGADAGFTQSGLVLTQGAEYTFSYYAKEGSSGADPSLVPLVFSRADGVAVDLRGFLLTGDCTLEQDTSLNYNTLMVSPDALTSDYARVSCTFTAPTFTSASTELSVSVSLLPADAWFDSVQLEQSAAAGNFHTGYSVATLDLSYVKVPPTSLGCTGNAATDATECANYAAVCSEVDVGCSAYTPTNGDPTVMGIAEATDSCPSSCVGYDTYKQEATLYEPNGDFPVYFIPESADSCTAADVGCDEFTNITTEVASYFTSLRACVTPDQALTNTQSDQSATFYTWEGSDTSGYQLKTWDLLQSNIPATNYTYAASTGVDHAAKNAPCTTWTAVDTSIACTDDADGDRVLDSDTSSCDEHSDTITNPDCREFYDTDGIIHYRQWSKTVTVSDSCVAYRKTAIVGAGQDTNPYDGADDGQANCTQSGGHYDALSVSCRYFGLASESNSCNASASGCRAYTGGRSRDSRQAFLEYFEDGSLNSWDSASASTVTLSNESIATDGHSLASNGSTVWTYVGTKADGSACTDEAGCASVAGALGGSCTINNGASSCGTLHDELYSGKTYTLSFWAKGTATLNAGFDTSFNGTAAIDASFASGVVLDGTWHEYSYGPLDMNNTLYPDFGNGLSTLVFAPATTGTFYVDNVILREGEDDFDVIKDSWVTPAECDQTSEGASFPQYYLGCSEYSDQNGDISNLKSFTSLCSEEKVGCSAYYETQESDVTTASVYGAQCSLIDPSVPATAATSCYFALNADGTDYDTTSTYLCTIGLGKTSCEFNLDWYIDPSALSSQLSYTASTVISPADRDVFLVVNRDVTCGSSAAGCMEVGLPVFSQDHTSVASWTTKYLMNTPADYASTLCSQGELFCDAWTSNDGTTSYFQNPQDQTCEYRTSVTVNGTTYSGWFKTGIDELCATNADGSPQYVVGGDQSGIWKNGDTSYSNWVGTCDAKYDTCTEFQDLADLGTEQLYGDVDGKSYFYLNNDSVQDSSLPDSEQCNGQVSQVAGCALFNNSAEPQKSMNMSASYVSSKHADALFGSVPNDLVNPIDCSRDSSLDAVDGSSVDLCANRCWYAGASFYDITNPSSTDYVFDGSCFDDSDCRPLTSESGQTVNGFCASSHDGVAAPRLENDANEALKVNRDRECSEWLSCSDAQTTWDERTNSYVTICGDIGLCTEYSGDGSASFCSAWKNDDPAIVLDTVTYAERDISWYGADYSGYAIPGALPVDQLTQVNVTPVTNHCQTAGTPYDGNDGLVCNDDSDCMDGDIMGIGDHVYCVEDAATQSDYRLGYVAGSCDGNYGDACHVGYCENTGSPCAATSQCGSTGGSCVVGTCNVVSTTSCSSDAQCGSGQQCLGDVCVTPSNNVPTIEEYSDTEPRTVCGYGRTDDDGSVYDGSVLNPSINFIAGTCVRNSCILTPSGATFATDTSEAKVCRGYPEINSPFPNSVVTAWHDPSDSNNDTTITTAATDGSDADATAVSYVQNFDAVQTCAFGENCECSYQKVSYGSGGKVMYYGNDTAIDIKNTGICSGGVTDGSQCDPSGANVCVGDGTTVSDGTCVMSEKVDDVLGLEGYCLERDSSTNILGDQDLRACITWLPVDQLAGSTDLYAKDTSAGYFAETNYCSQVELYGDIRPTIAQGPDSETAKWKMSNGAEILCAEQGTASHGVYSFDADDVAYCQEAVACPPGYFAVVGPQYDSSMGDSNFSYTCSVESGDKDCPMVCVPLNATDPDDDNVDCSIDGAGGDLVSGLHGDPVVRKSSASRFTSYAIDVQNCTARGRRVLDDNGVVLEVNNPPYNYESGTTVNSRGFVSYLDDWDSFDGIYGAQHSHTDLYMGCGTVVQTMTSNADNDAAPYTDYLLNPTQSELSNLHVGSGGYSSQFAYSQTSEPTPFGATISLDTLNNVSDPRPAILGACLQVEEADDMGLGVNAYHYFASQWNDNSCEDEFPSSTYPSLSAASPEGSMAAGVEARAFSAFQRPIVRTDSTPSDRNIGGSLVDISAFSAFTADDIEVSSTTAVYGTTAGSAEDGTGAAPMEGVKQVFARGLGAEKFYDGVFDETTQAMNSYATLDSMSRTSWDVNSGDEGWGPGSYTAVEDPDDVYRWDDRAVGNPPSLYALNANNCNGDKCEEDQSHSMTLNDVNSGNVTGDRFYRAYLKFYAAADKNQLPIRRVMIKWGDSISGDDFTGSDDDQNYYKNHRGLQPSTNNSICDTNTTSPDGTYDWGETPESCDQNYFSYSHIYTCNPTEITTICADTSGDGIYDNTPCKTSTDSGSCVFRPAVHVRDNWGWCTGMCDSTGAGKNEDGTSGCFDASGDGMSSSVSANECNFGDYPALDSAQDPWVYYDGTITVTP